MLAIDRTPYKLLDWIDPDKLELDYLSKNPRAISFLEKNQDKISWDNLSGNPEAILLLEENLDKINWIRLCHNPNSPYHLGCVKN